MARRLLHDAVMDSLIPDISNYCDGRCSRCPFTARCLTFLDSVELAESDAGRDRFERHRQDPLAVRAREYGQLAWRISRAIAPVVAGRGDLAAIVAVETIEWFSSLISSKIYRAITGLAEGWERADDVQTDFNGSAKVALIGIAESQRAWTVLMEVGKATANGVPAQAVRLLEEIDIAVRERFPRAMAFVRPGFDEPAIASGALEVR